MRVGQIHTDRTARLVVPIAFFLTGLGTLVIALAVVFTSDAKIIEIPPSAWPVVALVHGFTLGFLTMVMMGALYQLTPVLTNQPPISPRWIWPQAIGYLAGFVGLIEGLVKGRPVWLAVGGSLLLLTILGFAVLIASRLVRQKTWTIPLLFIATAVAYLVLTACMGSWLAWGYLGIRVTPLKPLWVHFSVGLGGWLGFLLMGVSYRLWLMFLPSRKHPRWWRWTYGLQQGAVITGIVGGFLGWRSGFIGAWLLGMGAWGTWAWDILGLVRANRLFRHEPSLWLPAAGGFFAVFAWIGGLMAWLNVVRWWHAILVAYVVGWVGLSFLGFVQKIIAFLVWLHRYSHVHGHGKMPRLTDIFPPRWSFVVAVSTIPGVTLWVVGWTISAVDVARTGVAVFGLGVVILTVAILVALVRKLKPRPLSTSSR